MAFQLPAFVTFLILASWFNPDATSFSVTEEFNGAITRQLVVDRPAQAKAYMVKLLMAGQPIEAAAALGQFVRQGAQARWSFGTGQTAANQQLPLDLAGNIQDFAKLDPKTVTEIDVKNVGRFKIQRTTKGLSLSGDNGVKYRFEWKTATTDSKDAKNPQPATQKPQAPSQPTAP